MGLISLHTNGVFDSNQRLHANDTFRYKKAYELYLGASAKHYIHGCPFLLMMFFGGLFTTSLAYAASVTVSTLEDIVDGDTASIFLLIAFPGPDNAISLREAITAANNSMGADEITFSVEGRMDLLSELPPINDISGGISIHGGGLISIWGWELKVNESCLTITSANNLIEGLTIVYFPNTAIVISGSSAAENTVHGCDIGIFNGARSGNHTGVLISDGAHHNNIGGATPETGNLIGGNHYGIVIKSGSFENVVTANRIGNLSRSEPFENYFNIVIQDSSNNNMIGGTSLAERNYIAGLNCGVGISTNCTGNRIKGNYIGVDATGTQGLIGYHGVEFLDGCSGNIVGGQEPGAGNLICSHSVDVYISASNDNIVEGNTIGLNTDSISRGFSETGIFLQDASENILGGSSPEARNIISCGRLGTGIEIAGHGSTGNTAQGNYIGTDVTGVLFRGNQIGVHIHDGAGNNQIGGSLPGAGNIICSQSYPDYYAYESYGILITGSNTGNNRIQGNSIGVNAENNIFPENNQLGVFISEANNNLIGGASTGERNKIAGNQPYGIQIKGSTALGNRISHNSIYSNLNVGIRLSQGGNAGLAAPMLLGLNPAWGKAPAGSFVELFADFADEGAALIATASADEEGVFITSINYQDYPNRKLNPTATDSSGNTSEFGTFRHSGDSNLDRVIELGELLRVIQLYNLGSYHCDSASEDGYNPFSGSQNCTPHNIDYNPQDWSINLTELLRFIQFFRATNYYYCSWQGEDGFCLQEEE